MAEIPLPPQKHKHRSFTLEFKVGVVEWVEHHSSSLRAAATHFGLDRKVLRSWIKKKSILRDALSSHGANNRKLHGGRGTISCQLDQEVLNYLKRNGGVARGVASIGDKALQQIAREYGEKLGVTGFKASGSWLKRWKERYQIGSCGSRNGNQTQGNGNPSKKNGRHGNGNSKRTIPSCQLSPLNSREKRGVVDMGVAECPSHKIEAPPKEKEDFYFNYNTPEHNYSMSRDLVTPTMSCDLTTPTSTTNLNSFHTHVANLLEGVAFLQSQQSGEVGLELTLGEEVGVAEKDVSLLSENVLNQQILPAFPGEDHTSSEFSSVRDHTSSEFSSVRDHTPSEFGVTPEYSSGSHTSSLFSCACHTPQDFGGSNHTPIEFSSGGHTPLLDEDHLMSMFNHRSFTDSFPFLSPALIGANWHDSREPLKTTPANEEVGINRKALQSGSHETSRSTGVASTATPTILHETPPSSGMVVASPTGSGGGLLANRRSQPVFPDEPEIIFHEIQLGPLHTTPLL